MFSDLRREHPGVNVRVEISNWELLVKRLLEEDIEFFVAETRDLPSNPLLHVAPLRDEPGGFYVRGGHPLARRRSVPIREVWRYGVVTVRLPASVRSPAVTAARRRDRRTAAPGARVRQPARAELIVAMQSESVLAAPHAAVVDDVATGALKQLAVPELPAVAAQMGTVKAARSARRRRWPD